MSLSITIRQPHSDRLENLRSLFLELHAHHIAVAPAPAGLSSRPAAEAWLRRRAFYESEQSHGAFVVEGTLDETTVAYAYASLVASFASWGSASPLGVIHDLVVSFQARRRGIGSAILERACEELVSRGAEAVRLNVMDGNLEALALYERHGFAPINHTLGRSLRS
jgi:ribosomal protein S18 acetylase RimI-like enzyme